MEFPTEKPNIAFQLEELTSENESKNNNSRYVDKSTQSQCVSSTRRNILAKKSKKQSKLPPIVGDFCFAHVRGYATWPAVVTIIDGNSAWVEFFNSGQR